MAPGLMGLRRGAARRVDTGVSSGEAAQALVAALAVELLVAPAEYLLYLWNHVVRAVVLIVVIGSSKNSSDPHRRRRGPRRRQHAPGCIPWSQRVEREFDSMRPLHLGLSTMRVGEASTRFMRLPSFACRELPRST